ncbi:hypothetical protein MXF17_05720 [Klebsiella aerogenes]|uniref:hypothetical protein n=1 Tax=Klebsiella aerogenes TaxID=548 RepID=UPI002DB5BC45|nr:hypothetical protein [Klebsiella aerogenes]MEB6076110.1 hypothetical protein [Klebsiella aerogenes]
MEIKDILTFAGLVITSITAAVGVYKLFKEVSWFLPKATRYSHIFEKYSEYIDSLETEFMKAEIKRDVKKSVLGMKNKKLRQLVLYVRTHSELNMPSWRWGHLAPHIQQKYGKFFIRYKGKYSRYRLYAKFAAVFYVVFGLVFPSTLLNDGTGYMIVGIILMLSCLYMAVTFWSLLPGRKLITKYNTELLKIDASKYQAS